MKKCGTCCCVHSQYSLNAAAEMTQSLRTLVVAEDQSSNSSTHVMLTAIYSTKVHRHTCEKPLIFVHESASIWKLRNTFIFVAFPDLCQDLQRSLALAHWLSGCFPVPAPAELAVSGLLQPSLLAQFYLWKSPWSGSAPIPAPMELTTSGLLQPMSLAQ